MKLFMPDVLAVMEFAFTAHKEGKPLTQAQRDLVLRVYDEHGEIFAIPRREFEPKPQRRRKK